MIIELLKDLSLIQYAFIQNQLIESMINNLRELLENQIDQENYNKESSWIASRSIALRNIFFVEKTYIFLFQSSSIIIHSTLFQTILIFFTMTFKNTSDKDKAFVDLLQ